MARIAFRPLVPGDVDAIHRLHGDPSTNLHNPSGANADLAASQAMLDEWVASAARDGIGYELAFVDGEPIGICGARLDVWRDRAVVNLYWRLLPEQQGRGLAASLATHALEVARRRRGEPIVARMLPGNAASRAVAERLGLERRPDLDGEHAGVAWIVLATPESP